MKTTERKSAVKAEFFKQFGELGFKKVPKKPAMSKDLGSGLVEVQIFYSGKTGFIRASFGFRYIHHEICARVNELREALYDTKIERPWPLYSFKGNTFLKPQSERNGMKYDPGEDLATIPEMVKFVTDYRHLYLDKVESFLVAQNDLNTVDQTLHDPAGKESPYVGGIHAQAVLGLTARSFLNGSLDDSVDFFRARLEGHTGEAIREVEYTFKVLSADGSSPRAG